jgi:uncharacterized protein (TIGR02391 family)
MVHNRFGDPMEQDSDGLAAGDAGQAIDRLLRGRDRLTILKAELESFNADSLAGVDVLFFSDITYKISNTLTEMLGSDIVDARGYYKGQDIPDCKRRFLALLDAGLSLLRQRVMELAFAERSSSKDIAVAWRMAGEALHPAIREDVWPLYHRGKYDTAVFEAMKAVEVAVRKAGNLPDSLLGVKLMRAAFAPAPNPGPLTDTGVDGGEQVARMELFAGSIGSYKNPHSHRNVDLDDADETAEIIMLANHLLRILDARRPASGNP